MHIIQEAGWPVWGVLILGAVAVLQALRYVRGTIGGGPLVAAVAALLCGGGLGTAFGVQLAFGGLHKLPDPAAQHWIAFVGVKEALYNLDVALLFALVAAMIAATGRRGAEISRST